MDTKQLIDLLTKNPAAGAAMGGLAGSVLGNVLGGKRGGGSLVKMGGLAAVGYVAYQAWQKHQSGKAGGQPGAAGFPAPGSLEASLGGLLSGGAPASPLPQSFDLESPRNSAHALRVVQAMIAASKADGVVDATERDRVFAKVGEAGLSQQDQDEVLRLLTQPMDMEAVVRGVDSRELAMEIYAASLLAVSPASRAERAYLDLLAARLGLDGDLTMQIEKTAESLLPR